METFAKLFERFLVFVYHCFDRIVIQGYLPLLTRPEMESVWQAAVELVPVAKWSGVTR